MVDDQKKSQAGDDDAYLIDFYGTECPHCHDMDPLTERLQKEEDVKIKKMEVWHDEKNAAYFMEVDKGRCGGVPFFYNKKTDGYICGSTSYEKLKEWALGK